MSYRSARHVSRILPGLKTEYSIVSMPEWAWPWLDNLVAEHCPAGYPELIRECAALAGEKRPLTDVLVDFALIARNDHYRLANDNARAGRGTLPLPAPAKRTYDRMPKAMKLFRFLPFATSWEAVISRRGLDRLPQSNY